MKAKINIRRRKFLQYTGAGLLGMAALPGWLRAMEKNTPNRASPNFHPDVELDLVARLASFPVLNGPLTNLYKYYGTLIKGPANSLTDIPGSYLGPIMRFQMGQKVRIHFRNELDEPCITHWHGLHVPALMEGHMMYAIDKGETFVYEFEVKNRAGTSLYHTHTHEMIGSQVYRGLAGGIIVEDEEERKLGLPSGEYDVCIVIQDRAFDGDNQLVYVTHMMERMTGFHGDRILINGKPDFELPVDSRAYRLRILNGSNARIYKLAWGDGSPLTVIGTDGGLLDQPVTKPYVMMGPGERIDVWADFSGREVGAELAMKSLPFSGSQPAMFERMMKAMGGGMGGGGRGGMGGMGGGMMRMPGMKLPVGSEYPVFKVRVTRKVSDSPQLPKQLGSFRRYQVQETANPNKPVPIAISEGPMSMLLNGRPYRYDDVQESEKVKLNTLQLMEIFHSHGGEGGHAGGTEQGKASGQGEGGHGSSGREGSDMGMGHGMMGGMRGGGMGGMGHGMMGGGMMGRGGMGQGMTGDGMQDRRTEKQDQGHSMGGGTGGMMGGMGGMMGGMGMMFSMAHPIHLHGQQFQIIRRELEGGEREDYATVKDGFIDNGPKDVALVMPGERVTLIKPFDDYTGLFTYHCHILEHEDMGMMRDFLVI